MFMVNPKDETVRVASICGFVVVVEADGEVEVPENKVEICQAGGLLPKEMVEALVKKAEKKAKKTPKKAPTPETEAKLEDEI